MQFLLGLFQCDRSGDQTKGRSCRRMRTSLPLPRKFCVSSSSANDVTSFVWPTSLDATLKLSTSPVEVLLDGFPFIFLHFLMLFLFKTFWKIKNLWKTSGDLGVLRVKDLTPRKESMMEVFGKFMEQRYIAIPHLAGQMIHAPTFFNVQLSPLTNTIWKAPKKRWLAIHPQPTKPAWMGPVGRVSKMLMVNSPEYLVLNCSRNGWNKTGQKHSQDGGNWPLGLANSWFSNYPPPPPIQKKNSAYQAILDPWDLSKNQNCFCFIEALLFPWPTSDTRC